MANKPAFTFAEILIALSVLTVSMYLFAGLQFRSMNRAKKGIEYVDRVFFVKKELYELYMREEEDEKKPEKPTMVEIENPNIKIVTERQKINKKSSLKDFGDEIDLILSKGTWESGPSKRSMNMVTFAPKPKKKEKPSPKGKKS